MHCILHTSFQRLSSPGAVLRGGGLSLLEETPTVDQVTTALLSPDITHLIFDARIGLEIKSQHGRRRIKCWERRSQTNSGAPFMMWHSFLCSLFPSFEAWGEKNPSLFSVLQLQSSSLRRCHWWLKPLPCFAPFVFLSHFALVSLSNIAFLFLPTFLWLRQGHELVWKTDKLS